MKLEDYKNKVQRRLDTKAKIQELCPDVMELKHGCRVWIDESVHDGQYSIWEYIGEVDLLRETLWKCVYSTFATVVWGQFKLSEKPHVILGSPITLAVVLRAIEKSYMARGISKAFLTSEQLWTVYGLWNLEKDRWEDQTKETQLFVGSLLGVV